MIVPSAKLSSGHAAPRAKRRHGQHPMIISPEGSARHPFTTTSHASRLDIPARHPPPWNGSRRRPAHGQHTCRQQRRPVTTRTGPAAPVSRVPRAARPTNYPGTSDTSWRTGPVDDGTLRRAPGRVLYLVVSGAPAPEGVPALVMACQAAGWRVVVFSTPTGTRFVDPAELEQLTGEPVRSEYRVPGTGTPVPPADAVLACPLTFNSVNKFAHGHADNFAVGLLCEMAGYGVPVVVVPHELPRPGGGRAADRGPGGGAACRRPSSPGWSAGRSRGFLRSSAASAASTAIASWCASPRCCGWTSRKSPDPARVTSRVGAFTQPRH